MASLSTAPGTAGQGGPPSSSRTPAKASCEGSTAVQGAASLQLRDRAAVLKSRMAGPSLWELQCPEPLRRVVMVWG